MQEKHSHNRSGRRIYLLILCTTCIFINFLGAHIARWLNLPLFLDIVGTALAAALGGYIPGIIVGFVTNLVNGIGDIETTYYSCLNVLIAVCSAWFSTKGYYGKWKKLPLIILSFAFIGGAVGSVLTFMLYGLDFGTGISAPLAHRIFESTGWSVFLSQFTADVLIDLADKTITVLIIALILRLLPKTLRDFFYFTSWHQKPLSRQARLDMKHHATRGMSLRSKIILLVATGMIITAVAVTGISYIHFTNASIEEQKALAWSVAQVVQKSFDHDRVDEYIEKGEAAEGYLQSETILKNLMDSSDNVEFCYVYRILENGCQVVFDPDTEDTPGEDPGTIISFDNAFTDQLPTLLAGGEIEPVISNETYGWLLTVYLPVLDSSGRCQCYAAVDISMPQLTSNAYKFLARVLSLFLGFFVLILTVAIWLAEYNIILPINTMSMATGQFAFDSVSARSDTLEKIRELDVTTGDEIENLYRAVVKTTEDMVQYIAHVQNQNEKINKLQNGLIMVLADMVESRDKCTGDHVRKTAAYAGIIMRQLKKDGLYLDTLTDSFMADVQNSAPLHDVGKIRVPDAILNKPGKLTDEEFELMKKHTTYGSEIIAQAMNTVSEEDSSYLNEARNLAHYHHEKWNGMGYPCGLKGEEIPLSARIMAVADVFDALVSKRPYKDGFPFERAMAIIRQSSGSHFDPSVTNAFMEAKEEVRQVMNTHMGN